MHEKPCETSSADRTQNRTKMSAEPNNAELKLPEGFHIEEKIFMQRIYLNLSAADNPKHIASLSAERIYPDEDMEPTKGWLDLPGRVDTDAAENMGIALACLARRMRGIVAEQHAAPRFKAVKKDTRLEAGNMIAFNDGRVATVTKVGKRHTILDNGAKIYTTYEPGGFRYDQYAVKTAAHRLPPSYRAYTKETFTPEKGA